MVRTFDKIKGVSTLTTNKVDSLSLQSMVSTLSKHGSVLDFVERRPTLEKLTVIMEFDNVACIAVWYSKSLIYHYTIQSSPQSSLVISETLRMTQRSDVCMRMFNT